jgi:3-hydroxyacyl-[acyl-carrier-protein] dehydratase
MQFNLVDRIVALEPGKRIVAVKNLSAAEEYLKDHFPKFPVMPGVLMIESMVQAAAWLVRVSTGFARSMICLAEARNIKYGAFVHPGEQLVIEVDALRMQDELASFRGSGRVETAAAVNVSGRFTLRMYNLRDRHVELADVDERLREHYRRQFEINGGAALLRREAAGKD